MEPLIHLYSLVIRDGYKNNKTIPLVQNLCYTPGINYKTNMSLLESTSVYKPKSLLNNNKACA